MKRITVLLTLLLSVAWLLPAEAGEVESLQRRWAEINYHQQGKQQQAAFAQLAEAARQAVAAQPDDPALRTWYGIILSSYAGAKGGLGALKLAKEARRAFEWVIDKNPNTLNGSALTSLGVLYHKVPGWPLGFGDEDKAGQLLARGVALNPEGIDSNYFYGMYLADEGQRQAAVARLNKARSAPARPDRPLADAGRRAEIDRLLTSLEAQ